MMFPSVLVMLSASPRMSGFIYQVTYKHQMCALWMCPRCFPSICGSVSPPLLLSLSRQGRLPLTGSTVSRQSDDTENGHYAFDITGTVNESQRRWRKTGTLCNLRHNYWKGRIITHRSCWVDLRSRVHYHIPITSVGCRLLMVVCASFKHSFDKNNIKLLWQSFLFQSLQYKLWLCKPWLMSG